MLTMTCKEWERLKEVLDLVLELPPDVRAAFIEQTCGTDGLLRRQAEAMIAAAERAGDFLERPVDAYAAGLLRQMRPKRRRRSSSPTPPRAARWQRETRTVPIAPGAGPWRDGGRLPCRAG